MPLPLRLALIDNYDSYTHNLSHLISLHHHPPPTIILSDAHPSLASLLRAHRPFDAYILSPGPGTPTNPADFSPLQSDILSSALPVLGVCLGHQAICHKFGASIIPSPAGPVHGRVSDLVRAPAGHDCPLLSGLPNVFAVVRYHSLCVGPPFGDALLPTAWATDLDQEGRPFQVLMAVRHRHRPLFGLQFHPESVCTRGGAVLISNFLRLVAAFRRGRAVPNLLGNDVRAGGSVKRPRGSGRWSTTLRQIDSHLNPTDIFRLLYGAKPHAFWLDSSNAVPTSMSRCSSPALDHPTDHHPRHTCPRYTIMGSTDGPLSEIVTYQVESRRVTVTQCASGESQVLCTTIFDYLQRMLRKRQAHPSDKLQLNMNGGYVGFLGYELKRDVHGVRNDNPHRSWLPDAWFIFADRLVIIDHHQDDVFLVALHHKQNHAHLRSANEWFHSVTNILHSAQPTDPNSVFHSLPRPTLRFTPDTPRTVYLQHINQCLKAIHDGDTYEVCLTNRLRTTLPDNCNVDPLDIYCALRLLNPAPYSAFLRLSPDISVCCSSPERYLQISPSGRVESKPIKGTLPRGQSLQEDEELRNRLANSVKDRSENLMIVDLVRNDLSRSCDVGSVRVPKLMHVESYATVHQLVSTVTGQLSPSNDAVDCIRTAYPMGSMTGAPKVRTMEIIDRLETSARGIYSGSIGYLSVCGAADLNVVIRTAVLAGSEVEIGVGGAIVALSDPEEEYDEVILKGRAIMQSLALKTTGQTDFIVEHERPETIDKIAASRSAAAVHSLIDTNNTFRTGLPGNGTRAGN